MKTFFICSTILLSATVVSSSIIAHAFVNNLPQDVFDDLFEGKINLSTDRAPEDPVYSFRNDN